MRFGRRFRVRHTACIGVVLALVMCFWVVSVEWRSSPGLSQPQPREFYVAPNGNDANPGSLTRPWATVHHAADVLKAGETVYLRAGTYPLSQPIKAHHSGTAKQWITYRAFPGDRVILDASAVRVAPPSGHPPFAHDQGAFQLEDVQYIQVQDLTIRNSHNSGITVRNSHHIRLYHNQTENTFSPGIGVWHSSDQKVIGNTVINANAREMADFPNDFSETPHEAISLGSVETFEVAYNLVRDGQKEGIDIKETSKHGTVHHNYVHHMARQAFYIDSWYGSLTDVEVAHNVAHDGQGAGLVVSVEGGAIAQNIQIHHNLLYDNWGTGIFFSRWGDDGLRQNVKIYNNTVHHNGHGKPKPGEQFFWLTGGLYLFSDNLNAIEINHNIFSDNAGFQIGYSDRFLKNAANIDEVLRQKQIWIHHNFISGANNTEQPIYAGWPPDDYAHIYATQGTPVFQGTPHFIDSKSGNFALKSPITPGNPEKPQPVLGAFPSPDTPNLWWQKPFPPRMAD